jgi:nucleoside-diphosphate-sugar epimerase
VVTGASGFIGSRVVALLQEQGRDVIGVGRRACSLPGYVRVDEYKKAPEGDVLVHLAEPNTASGASGAHEQACSLARDLCRISYGRQVYGSSMAVYSDRLQGLRSTDEKVVPRGPYAKTKIACEQIFLDQGRSAAVARIANVYGPGMSPANVMSCILDQLNDDHPTIRLMNLSPVRDFIWVDDVARGICALALGTVSGLFNLGTGIGTSIRELCDIILQSSGCDDCRVIAMEAEKSHSRLVLDITETLRALSWQPEVDLETGISALLKALR